MFVRYRAVMATLRQIDANRRNSIHSTGPRSVEGKTASRFNAVKHGVDARSLVIPGEDPAELEALAHDYHEQFRPVGPLESFLVDTLVQSDWNKRRYARAEAQLLSAVVVHPEVPTECPLGAVFARDDNQTLQRIFRRLQAAEQSYFRSLKELRRTQAERQSQGPDDDDPAEAAAPRLPLPSDVGDWVRSAPSGPAPSGTASAPTPGVSRPEPRPSTGPTP